MAGNNHPENRVVSFILYKYFSYFPEASSSFNQQENTIAFCLCVYLGYFSSVLFCFLLVTRSRGSLSRSASAGRVSLAWLQPSNQPAFRNDGTLSLSQDRVQGRVQTGSHIETMASTLPFKANPISIGSFSEPASPAVRLVGGPIQPITAAFRLIMATLIVPDQSINTISLTPPGGHLGLCKPSHKPFT